jgi:hypothetical protein
MHPDRIAQKAGWLVLESNQAYMKNYHYSEWWQKEQIEKKEVYTLKSRTASLYIFKEGDAWVLWRATFKSDQSEPLSERILGKNRDIRKLIARGEDFITWWKTKKDSQRLPRKEKPIRLYIKEPLVSEGGSF